MSEDNTIEIGEVAELPGLAQSPAPPTPITGILRALVISPGHADLVSLRLEDRHAAIYFCAKHPAQILWKGRAVTLGGLVTRISEAEGKVAVTLHPDRSRYGLSTRTEFEGAKK